MVEMADCAPIGPEMNLAHAEDGRLATVLAAKGQRPAEVAGRVRERHVIDDCLGLADVAIHLFEDADDVVEAPTFVERILEKDVGSADLGQPRQGLGRDGLHHRDVAIRRGTEIHHALPLPRPPGNNV